MTVAGDQMPPTDENGKILGWNDPYEAYVGHPRTAGSHAATLRLAREHKIPLMQLMAQNSFGQQNTLVIPGSNLCKSVVVFNKVWLQI